VSSAAIQAVRVDIRRLDEKIDGVDDRLNTKIDSLHAQMGSMKNEIVSEIRRLDARIDGVDRELHTAIDLRERLAALEARRG
jgi:flagellin-like hook-associated protein FlgL